MCIFRHYRGGCCSRRRASLDEILSKGQRMGSRPDERRLPNGCRAPAKYIDAQAQTKWIDCTVQQGKRRGQKSCFENVRRGLTSRRNLEQNEANTGETRHPAWHFVGNIIVIGEVEAQVVGTSREVEFESPGDLGDQRYPYNYIGSHKGGYLRRCLPTTRWHYSQCASSYSQVMQEGPSTRRNVTWSVRCNNTHLHSVADKSARTNLPLVWPS